MKADTSGSGRVCKQCNKGFSSEPELKIHQKLKHNEDFNESNQNINSSDLSEDEEEGIKRFREQFVKRPSQINRDPNKNEQEARTDGEQSRQNDNNFKSSLPGRFDDPSIVQNQLKKVYLCGCEHKTFDSTAALSMHIKKQHNGFPPQGTLYGVSRQLVRRQFQPLEEKPPAIRPHIQKTAFVCGCGLSYIQLSSLRYHIRTNHDGETPFGTIGLTRGPLSRKNEVLKNNDQQQAECSDSRSSIDKRSEEKGQLQALMCSLCQEPRFNHQWTCRTCDKWRLCSDCSEQQQAIREHEGMGHSIRSANEA